MKLGSFPQASWVHKSIAFWLFNFFIDQEGNQPQEEVQIEVGRGKRRRGRQRMRWLDSVTDSVNMNVSNSGRWWRSGKPGVLQSPGLQRVRPNLVSKQQQMTTEERNGKSQDLDGIIQMHKAPGPCRPSGLPLVWENTFLYWANQLKSRFFCYLTPKAT